MGHHIGNSGHAATHGCIFCTMSKAYKHECAWMATDAMLVKLMGEPRTTALNHTVMAKFEDALREHMTVNAAKYARKDPAFVLADWCKDGLIYRQDHPAKDWIVTYSRTKAYNYRSEQIYLQLPDTCFIFDGTC